MLGQKGPALAVLGPASSAKDRVLLGPMFEFSRLRSGGKGGSLPWTPRRRLFHAIAGPHRPLAPGGAFGKAPPLIRDPGGRQIGISYCAATKSSAG